MSQFWATLPPGTVFVPSQHVQPGSDSVDLVLRQVTAADGTDALVLATYSSLDALVALCGEDQPWVAIPSETVEGLRDQLGVSAVVLDVPFDPPAASTDSTAPEVS